MAAKLPFCITLMKASCRCLPVGGLPPLPFFVLRVSQRSSFGDHRSIVFVFARAGGCDGHMALMRMVSAFVAFACSATAGAAGGRGATVLSSMTGSNVLLAAVMGAGGRGSFFMARAAGGCFPS